MGRRGGGEGKAKVTLRTSLAQVRAKTDRSLPLPLSYSLLSSQDLAVRRNRERTLGGSSSLSRSLSLAGLGKGTTFLPPSLAAITPTTHVSRQLSVLLPSSVQGDAPLALPSPPPTPSLPPSLPPCWRCVRVLRRNGAATDGKAGHGRLGQWHRQLPLVLPSLPVLPSRRERERARERERERDAVCVLCQ